MNLLKRKNTKSIIDKNYNIKTYNMADIVTFKRGNGKYTKKYMEENPGKYPVYSSKVLDEGQIGSINTYDYNGDYVYYTTDGYAGHVFLKLKQKFSLTSHACVLLPKDDNILNLKYLYYYLKANQIFIYRLRKGTAIPMVTIKSFSSFEILVPKLETQEHIVNRIKYLELDILKMKHLLQQMKHLLQQMKHLLQKALNYAFCNLGDLEPKIMKLGDIGVFKGGISNLNKINYDTGISFINYMDIYKNTIINNKTSLRLYNATENEYKRFSVNYGDILLTASSETIDEIATTSLFLDSKKAIFNGFSKIYKFNHKILLPYFAIYYLKSSTIRRQLNKYATGFTRYNISQYNLNKIIIEIPNIENQQKIINFIHPLYSKLETIINKTDRLIKTQEELVIKIANSLLNKEMPNSF